MLNSVDFLARSSSLNTYVLVFLNEIVNPKHLHSSRQFGGQEKKKQISSKSSVVTGLFPVRFNTEIISVLVKKNRKRSIFP